MPPQDSVDNYKDAFQKVLSDQKRFSCSIDADREKAISDGFKLPTDHEVAVWTLETTEKNSCDIFDWDPDHPGICSKEATTFGYVACPYCQYLSVSVRSNPIK